jgi:hypothetical protein
VNSTDDSGSTGIIATVRSVRLRDAHRNVRAAIILDGELLNMAVHVKLRASMSTFNAPSALTLWPLAGAINCAELDDPQTYLLDPEERAKLLIRMLSTSAAVN